MASFRITYHTTGGSFSRLIESENAETAEKTGLDDIGSGETFSFIEKEIRFVFRCAQVAAVSVQEDKSAAGGERRSAGFRTE